MQIENNQNSKIQIPVHLTNKKPLLSPGGILILKKWKTARNKAFRTLKVKREVIL
jgi:hypothetical protein